MKSKIYFLCLVLVVIGCHHVSDNLEPQMGYAVRDKYLLNLPAPFKPLTPEESSQDWGKEMQIGFGFAQQLDLYQAITAFRRSAILIPANKKERKLEAEYETLLCYFLGGKYGEVTYLFEHSDLRYVDKNFPAFEDLLIILFDSYLEQKQDQKAENMREYIQQIYPTTGDHLTVSRALLRADLPTLHAAANVSEYSYLEPFLDAYEKERKSMKSAEWLNALLPGAGYMYLGQRQSAVTALLLNGLFIAASYYFFDHRNIPAGIIFASFEAGWYFGGIVGAKIEAKLYNERLYEGRARSLMEEQKLFPVLMLSYGF